MSAPSIRNARGANRLRLQIRTLIERASCPCQEARQALQTPQKGPPHDRSVSPLLSAPSAVVLRPQPFDLGLLVAARPRPATRVDVGCTSQRRTVSRPTPNLPATAVANAVSDG
jgi:hypothetical protein